MYEGHFQLHRRPFAATPDPSCCYLSPTHSPLIQGVARCIEHGQGIAIITGPAGIGKTLLTQVLLADAEPRFTGAYLGTGQFPTRRALLQAILYELGQPYGGMTDQELRLELNTTLRHLITRQDGLLLVLDEAHLLSDRLLEEIRLLADLAQHGVPLTRVVLSGNPEFEERLTSPTLAAFNQRVACHAVLETLTRPESIAYLEHRLRWAGGEAADIFEREALQLIADASDGLPRCLNQLADRSLMQAYLAGQPRVAAAIVRQTLAELQHLPLRWNPSALHDRTSSNRPQFNSIPAQASEASDNTGAMVGVSDSDDPATCSFEFGADDAHGAPLAIDETADIAEPVQSAAWASNPDDDSVLEIHTSDAADEDDDGPPLFAWLAQPAEKATAPADAYSTSSFNIPARQRQRTQSAELEVVSMAPLTGAELSERRSVRLAAARSSPSTISTSKFSAGTILPAQELVIDAYASLDAQQSPMFPQPAVTFPVVTIPSNRLTISERAPEWDALEQAAPDSPDAATIRDAAEPVAQETDVTHFGGNPLDRIDALCELLERADEPALGCGGVELITDYGVEHVDVDLPTNTPLPLTSAAAEAMTVDLEHWIGSTVVEVGRNIQQAGAAGSGSNQQGRRRAARLDQLLDQIEQELEFDVVEPHPEKLANEQSNPIPEARQTPPGNSGAVPPPNHNYKNFFSLLRRRQTR